MWLKTLNSSTTCGTVTLKSPLSRVFSAPHVHPRLRKRLSRCTLDCGFKTSESPALRGFVAGLRALATAALYLVIKRCTNSAKSAARRQKKKSRRTAAYQHAYEAAALSFRAAVSLRLQTYDDLQGHGSRWEVSLPCPFFFFIASMICTS